jgi:tetratricopeptide (TPR) repeat protein
VLERSRLPRAFVAALLLGGLLPSRALAGSGADPAAAFDRATAAAEASLREDEVQIAESQYRSALLEGWLLMGALEIAEGRLPAARDAFRDASVSAVETRSALRSLAVTQLAIGEAASAVDVLTQLVGRRPGDAQVRRLLAQALVANGQPKQAVQELEEARAAAPDDPELAFALATGYLRLKKVDAAERLFAEIAARRPIAATHVLIGRTYRDVGEYERARTELRAALKLDPRARRAHYYLGMVAVAEGMSRLDEAIAEFQAEVKLAPQDAPANLELGMALVEARRHEEALPALEIALRSGPPQALALYYLGRCQLALDRRAEAVASLRRALELAPGQGAGDAQIRLIHNQLGTALREVGATDEAASHFAEAERLSARGAEAARQEMERRMAEAADPETGKAAAQPLLEESPLAALPPAERLALQGRVKAGLARTYLNLGLMQLQRERFPRAAELLEKAAALDPDFPQVQYSLGVARFNAKQFDKATGPLARAVAASPQDGAVKRMLAMASLNTEAYEQAAALLRNDPELETDPSLQFAYGLALVRSNRAAEAQSVFAGLLARHGDSAQVRVVLGQAYAQQGDYESAIESLMRALQLEADVAEANGALGIIYLEQGRLPEAERALKAELAGHPDDVKSENALASVLEMQGRPEEAVLLLRRVLKSKPELANARYLLGKILLAQGDATEAVVHLEAAARMAPEDANIHYQLGRAYQTLGRTEESQREFETFRQIKDKRRENAP